MKQTDKKQRELQISSYLSVEDLFLLHNVISHRLYIEELVRNVVNEYLEYL